MESQERLTAFIELGQRVIREAGSERYGSDSIHVPEAPPACRFPQPGFLGREYAGIVIMNPHPGEGAHPGREPSHRRWDLALQRWLERGDEPSYETALRLWEADRASWGPVWTRWLAPLLDEAGVSVDQVAFLNLIKNQLRSNTSEPVQRRLASRDWTFTSAQLALLKPRAVLAGGKFVGRVLNAKEPEPPFEVRVQSRARAIHGVRGPERRALEERERSELAAWLRQVSARG